MNLKNIIKNSLTEVRGFTPPKVPPKNIKNILSKISLFEMYPKIFAVVIKDNRLRARVFMRYQEFYESDSETFRGKGFKWSDYVKFYKEKTKNDIFTYHEDWSGYNMPCDSIESCMKVIPDLNFYDLIMFSIVDTIKKIVGSDNFYLIGIDQANGEDPSLIHHEIAHGLWFSDPKYKAIQQQNIDNMDDSVREKFISKIKNAGYGDNVVNDELQAYLSTGTAPMMNVVKDKKKNQIPFVNTFEGYSKKIKPKQIPIDWSTDLDA
ncbi:hypothetical protein EBU94_07910 [bacterium]|nr:hypothetical protein [bacterium]